MSAYLGVSPLVAVTQKWPLLFSYYLPTAAIGIVYPGLGEEPGWRGFALPRLQNLHGPLMASLILGVLHGLWHLPAYFIPGAIQDGPFQLIVFVTNTCGIIASTIVWTWLFNSAKGSILFAMLVHGISNAISSLVPQWLDGVGAIHDPWFVTKVMGVCALLIIAFTRGKLGYSTNTTQAQPDKPSQSALPGWLQQGWVFSPMLVILLAATSLIFISAVIGLLIDPRLVLNAPVWAKTFKFSVSMLIYGATLCWMLPLLKSKPRAARWVANLTGGVLLLELVLMIVQGIRGVPMHFNESTPIDRALWQAMSTGIFIFYGANIFGALLLAREKINNRVLSLGIKLGLLMAMIGFGLGFLI